MSFSNGPVCQYCGRCNFSSQHGLTKHLERGQCHEEHMIEMAAQNSRPSTRGTGGSPRNRERPITHVAPAAPQKEEANFLGIHDLEEDELAPVAMDIDDHLGAPEWSHEDDSGDDEDFLYGMRRGGKKSPASSYDSEAPAPKETPEPPQPGQVDTNQGPNTWIRDQFQECVEGHVGNFLPFTKAEITAIKLLDTLKKRRPL